MRAVIRGTGMYVPPAVVDNHLLSRVMDTTDEWIQQRTGIRERHFAYDDVTTSDLSVPAAQQAMKNAGIGPEDVDYIIFATMTPDYFMPGAGPYLQKKLGMVNVPCLDIRQQCAGFIYGMQVADAMVRSGQYRNILLVGAEIHCGLMPWKSWDILLKGAEREVDEEEFSWNTRFRDRTVLFGDGAGAVVVSASDRDSGGILDILMQTDGGHADKIWCKTGGSAFRPFFDPSHHETGDTVPVLEGRDVFKLAVTLMPQAAVTLLEKNGYSIENLDLLIMHQANLRINEFIQKKLGLPDEKVYNNIQKYGNTTAATIPMAFHEAVQDGRVKEGDLVCFVALGSGLHWGAVLYQA